MSSECKHRSSFAESSARRVIGVLQELTAFKTVYSSPYLMGSWVDVSGKCDENPTVFLVPQPMV